MELRFLPSLTSSDDLQNGIPSTAISETSSNDQLMAPPLPPLPSSASKIGLSLQRNSKEIATITTPLQKQSTLNASGPANHLPSSHHNLHYAYNNLPSQGMQPSYNNHQTSPPPQSPTMLHKQLPQPLLQATQNNNHHYTSPHHYQGQPITPSLENHRRTLERSARNLHYPAAGVVNMDNSAMADGIPTRIPSLRRTRRISGNNNHNNGNIGIPIVPGSPRVQRSPMPARAMIKRNRLGSRSDNISSGSLNSIEV